jgi:pimeloyl-ACP methyl ester carboxylesterase
MPAPGPRRVDYRVDAGLTLAADAYGDPSAPAVLFLHGGGQTRHAWGGAARAIAEAGFFTVSLDHRGHGESGWAPDGDYQIEAFVADLRSVLAELPARPFLVGASLGGITAMLAEGTSPEPLSRGLVLVDVTPRLEVQGVMRVLGFMRARPDGFATLEEAADTIAEYLPHRRRPKDLRGLEKNLRRGADGRYRWHWDPKLMEAWNPAYLDPEEVRRSIEERRAAAGRLRVPVLLVRGRMSEVVSEEVTREFLALAPHAEYVDLATGHMVAGDSNDAFTEAVLGFLERQRAGETGTGGGRESPVGPGTVSE